MKKLSFLILTILFFNCSKASEEKILFIVSNQSTYGNSELKTYNHFGEIVFAYDVFKKNNYIVDFVSPNGGKIPIGYIDDSDTIQKKYLEDEILIDKFKNTKKPSEINFREYKAVYYVGGGAAMFGVPEDKDIQEISMNVYNNNGIISAVCHGTAGIVNLKNNDGTYLFANKEVNGFPDLFEDMKADYYKTFPFSIEGIIKERGGKFSYSDKGWDNYYKVDGRLITGQDPTAAATVAQEIVRKLNKL